MRSGRHSTHHGMQALQALFLLFRQSTEVLRTDMLVLFQVSTQLSGMKAELKIPLIRRIALFRDILH